jgi:hypothetical protein
MDLQAAQTEQSLLQAVLITATFTPVLILVKAGNNRPLQLIISLETGRHLQAVQTEQSLLQVIL